MGLPEILVNSLLINTKFILLISISRKKRTFKICCLHTSQVQFKKSIIFPLSSETEVFPVFPIHYTQSIPVPLSVVLCAAVWPPPLMVVPTPAWSSLGSCSSHRELPLIGSAGSRRSSPAACLLSTPLHLFPSPALGADTCEQGCPVLAWQLLEGERLFMWLLEPAGAGWHRYCSHMNRLGPHVPGMICLVQCL